MSPNDSDVIVIGAGVAGLTAARILGRERLSVIILEARDRAGGRIFTRHDHFTGLPIELGAEFIHGRPKQIWDVKDAADLDICDVPDERWLFEDEKLKKNDGFFSRIEHIIGLIDAEAPDESFASFIAKYDVNSFPENTIPLIISYIENFHAARIDRLGTHALYKIEKAASEIDGNNSFRIRNGYDRLSRWLLSTLEPHKTTLYFNRAVNEVRWANNGVEIVSRSGADNSPVSVTARKAVITLPLGVLKIPENAPGAVRFRPELAEKRQEAINDLEMGQVVKIVFRFRDRFWEHPSSDFPGKKGFTQMSFVHLVGEEIRTWWTALPLRAPLITGWVGGPAAGRLLAQGEKTIIETALNSLSKLFGIELNKIENMLEAWHFHDWKADIFAGGAYSYIPVDGLRAQEILARPADHTLFFAGEATDLTGNIGTTHGAMASGERAANELLSTW